MGLPSSCWCRCSVCASAVAPVSVWSYKDHPSQQIVCRPRPCPCYLKLHSAAVSNSMSAHTPLDIIADLETYLGAHDLDSVVKEMMVQCFKERPEQPEGWMLRYMVKHNANTANDECAVASTADAATHIVVTNSDAATQQYLCEKKIHLVFMELLKQVIQEKPDHVLSFIATAAHNMHKEPPPGLH